MELTLQKPALVAAETTKPSTMVYPEKWVWAAGTGVLWGLSYFFWRRLQAGSERS